MTFAGVAVAVAIVGWCVAGMFRLGPRIGIPPRVTLGLVIATIPVAFGIATIAKTT